MKVLFHLVLDHIGDIISAVVALLTFWTIREVQKQRRHTYLPDLFIGNAFTDVYSFNLAEQYESFEYETRETGEYSSRYDRSLAERSRFFELAIYNIGLGAAKFVEYEWSFDFETLKKLVINENRRDKYFNISDDKEAEIIIERDLPPHYGSADYKRAFLKNSINFVLPAGTETVKYVVHVPSEYVELLSYYIVLKYDLFQPDSKKLFYSDELAEVPLLSLRINYRDVAGYAHQKKFKLKFQIRGYGLNEIKRPLPSKAQVGTYSIRVEAF